MPLRIDILSDTICPWCFIGKRRLEQALDRSGTEADLRWHPFQLNPDMPPEGMSRSLYVKRKFGRQGSSVLQHVIDAGRSVGIEFDFDRVERTPNTVDSHRLLARAAETGLQDPVAERLFRAYFLEGLDVGDPSVLVQVASEAGLETDDIHDFLAGREGRSEVAAADQAARSAGIQGVPFFILEGKVALSGAQEPEAFLQAFQRLPNENSSTRAPDPERNSG